MLNLIVEVFLHNVYYFFDKEKKTPKKWRGFGAREKSVGRVRLLRGGDYNSFSNQLRGQTESIP